MEQFSQAIQKYLMKMEQKHDKLKFLSSRATKETTCIINEITETITAIFKEHNMLLNKESLIIDPLDETCHITTNIVHGYNWLLLNTHFKSQYSLTEDVQYGYMVGQWPSLSPYLFIQIIWHFKYEIILAESSMYIPMDLYVEILEIVVKCIHELEHERARCLIIRLTGNIYKKCLQLNMAQVSGQDLKKYAWQLVAYFKTLLDQLIDSKITDFPELSTKPSEEEYQKHGIFIKLLLRHIEKCICMVETIDKDCTTANLFTLSHTLTTDHNMLSIDDIESIIKNLTQELITLLLKQLKQIDFHEFLYWAEVVDTDNVMVSLQRAIVIECQNFMQFMKRNIFPENNDDLQLCLQQIVGNSEPILSLAELCSVVTLESRYARELSERYKEWDESTLNFINQNLELIMIDKYVLFDYLYHISTIYKRCRVKLIQTFYSVLKILIRLDIHTFYSNILRYTTSHLHDNPLMLLFKMENFIEFMAYNESICESRRARRLLIYFLLNAKAVLFTLVKIVIGCKEYKHIVFTAQNMLLLRPFICINVNDRHNMLISCLKNICMRDVEWCCKKFLDFVNIMLKEEVIHADQLMNDVYIPHVTNAPFIYSNFIFILLSIHDILRENLCSDRTNYTLLVIGLIKKASFIRKCNITFPVNYVDEAIKRIKSIVFIIMHDESILNEEQEREIANAVNELVEPIDQINLNYPIYFNQNVMEIMQDYERRCFIIHKRLCIDTSNACRYKLITDIKLDRRALIRHMILHTVDDEYYCLMNNMILLHWFYFGWTSEKNAFENIMSISIEALRLTMIYKNIFPKDKFSGLLITIVNFCKSIAISLKDTSYVVNVLFSNLASLYDIFDYEMFHSLFKLDAQMFKLTLSHIQANLTQVIYEDVNVCFTNIAESIKYSLDTTLLNLLEYSDPIADISISDIQNTYIEYLYVCACIKVFRRHAHSCTDELWNIIQEIVKL